MVRKSSFQETDRGDVASYSKVMCSQAPPFAFEARSPQGGCSCFPHLKQNATRAKSLVDRVLFIYFRKLLSI
jgi:hypothetical protein